MPQTVDPVVAADGRTLRDRVAGRSASVMSPGLVGCPVTVATMSSAIAPVVEGVGAPLGDAAQGRGEGRVLQQGADRLRAAVRLEEVGPRARVLPQRSSPCRAAR